jgi:hypothetical protein
MHGENKDYLHEKGSNRMGYERERGREEVEVGQCKTYFRSGMMRGLEEPYMTRLLEVVELVALEAEVIVVTAKALSSLILPALMMEATGHSS